MKGQGRKQMSIQGARPLPHPTGSIRVLVTGASGFIGAEVARHLEVHGISIVRGGRALTSGEDRRENWVAYGDLAGAIAWSELVEGFDVVVNCAGLASVDTAPAAIPRSSAVNVAAPAALAEACAAVGVKRFVHVSSAQVLGSSSPAGGRLDDRSPVAPETPYAQSKREAEERLNAVAARTGLELVILRPPLVYGRGAQGNFRRLASLVNRRVALPFGRAIAPKSFIAVENFASAVAVATSHPDVAGRTFLVADAELSSTRDLIERIARAQGRSARLLPIPEKLVQSAAALVGAGSMVRRLFEPFAIDWSEFAARTNWRPEMSMDQALASAYRHSPLAGADCR